MKLSELRARRPASKTIMFRGTETALHFVTAAESMAMENVLPRPNVGDSASQNHPRNLAAMNTYESRLAALIAGSALDIEGADGQRWAVDRDQKWSADYADLVLDELSAEEIKSVVLILRGWLMDMASDVRLIGDETHAGN